MSSPESWFRKLITVDVLRQSAHSISWHLHLCDQGQKTLSATFPVLILGLPPRTSFTVEWENVILRDEPHFGAFTFQVTLHVSGDVVFVYKNIPVIVENIRDVLHPVKVGLSDAYISDQVIF
ncbi:hypothetical protein PR048_001621 [Dryococelus australis]|uniref:Uncharacterized protein n=1 Tax=Dryococelus australis TaxID=614101 RepID=A0ABQ9IHZ2_9NEOP|nr:hypothetical protein PR048_001621 [Dryococelus australis]